MASTMFDLTPLTGRKATADRTVVIMTYDVNYLLARVVLLSLLPSMLLGMLAFPLLHSYAIVVVALAELGFAIVFYARSSTGLQLRIWRRLWNRSRANLGKVFLRNVIVDTAPPTLVMATQASMPNPLVHDIDDDQVFGEPPAGRPVEAEPLLPAPDRMTGIQAHDWYLPTS